MGKILSKITLFLLLGVVTTIAVAWSCALWVATVQNISLPSQPGVLIERTTPAGAYIKMLDRSDERNSVIRIRHMTTKYAYLRSDGMQRILKSFEEEGNLFDVILKVISTEEEILLEEQRIATMKDYDTIFVDSGWPIYAFEGGMWMITDTQGAIRTAKTVYETAIPINQNKKLDWLVREPRVLPLRPKPIGLIINSVFYGLIWYGIFAGLKFTRSKIRLNGGKCPKCAYILKVEIDKGCPECGWNR